MSEGVNEKTRLSLPCPSVCAGRVSGWAMMSCSYSLLLLLLLLLLPSWLSHVCMAAPLPLPSTTVDYKYYSATRTISKLPTSSTAPPSTPAPSSSVSLEENSLSAQPFLPAPTDVNILLVNSTAVRVQWSFDYSAIRPPTLRTALSFAVEVTILISPSHTEVFTVTVPGDHLYLLFTKVDKHIEYNFGVTAQSGNTSSHTAQPSDSLLGGVSSCPLPTNLTVTAVEAFSVTLAWERLCDDPYSVPLYYIKQGRSPEEMHRSQSRLFTSDLSYTIQSLKPAHKYYFCVGAQYQHATICTGLVQATTHTVELPQLAAPKIRGGLRSISITWSPPPLATIGVAILQYNVYHMMGPARAFDQRRAQRKTVAPEKGLHTTLEGLDPVANYSVVVTYMVVKAGKPPSFWEKESAASPVATDHSAPDAQSFSVRCLGCTALSPEVLRIFWQVDPPAGGHGDLHMTLHLSDMQAQRSVVSTRDWTGGQLDVGGLSPWSSHQYSLQLEDQFGHKGRHYACEYCRTLEEAPSVAPSHLSVQPSGESYYVSWRDLPKDQRNGVLEYRVLLHQCDTVSSNTHLSDVECRRCVQQATPTTLSTIQTSISLGTLRLDTAYAVNVRGVTGGGSLEGPLSAPSCFITPEGAPNQAPAVRYHFVLGRAVCIEWGALARQLQFGDVLGYTVNVSEGLPGGNPATFHQTNLSDPEDLHYLLPKLREGMAYNITVQAYSRAGVGPPSDCIAVHPKQLEQSKTDVGLKATHDTSNACSAVTISWAGLRDGCGSYRHVLEYYVASNGSSTLRSIPVSPNATYLKLSATEFSPETEYEFRLKTSYASPTGYTVQETASDPAKLYIPYCQQLLDHTVITVLSILSILVAVAILLTLVTLTCCHYRRTRLSQRTLRHTPRFLQRMRHRQNPYLLYPVHREGSPYISTSGSTSVPSNGSDPDDPPLPLGPSLQHDLGGYISLPLNNTQMDSLTRSLSPIAMHEMRHLVDKEKSPPPTEQFSAAESVTGALQKRRRPIGQSDTTVYGDSSSSDSDSDSDSDDSFLQT